MAEEPCANQLEPVSAHELIHTTNHKTAGTSRRHRCHEVVLPRQLDNQGALLLTHLPKRTGSTSEHRA